MNILSHTALISVTNSTLFRLINVLLKRPNIKDVGRRLLLRANMNIILEIMHTVRRGLNALTLARHVFSNRLTKRHNTANRHSLRRVTQHRLTTVLTRLGIYTVITRHVPQAIFITLGPRSLARDYSFVFDHQQSNPSPYRQKDTTPNHSPTSLSFSVVPLDCANTRNFSQEAAHECSLPCPHASQGKRSSTL